MMKINAPKSHRLHIGIFGRRNVGKSSLLNTIARQNASIVSEVAGTTTDPVEKAMELLPLGPVLLIDTAGLDDTAGPLGTLRVAATDKIFERTDLGLIVTSGSEWGEYEQKVLERLRKSSIPAIAVFNKCDIETPDDMLLESLKKEKTPVVLTSAKAGEGVFELREAIIRSAPEDYINTPTILADLVGPGKCAVLVVPIDMEAPKGRLILPQVQAIRDLLDGDSYCMVVKERELREALDNLRNPPALVVTDSQAFLKVAADTPLDVPLTSFSILFARFKGELTEFVRGALAIEKLKPGDRVIIAEACSHHPIGEDIGRVKIPRWLTQYVGGKLNFEWVQGHDFPANLDGTKLIIHCGACMWNRREVLTRIMHCREAGIPLTNYGMSIAYSLGIFERALGPFPAALEEYRRLRTT